MTQVLAGGERFLIDRYEREPAAFGAALARAKAEHGYAKCLCTQRKPPLVIRRLSRAEGPRYFLATWPNHGSAHALRCRFHRSDQDDAQARALHRAAVQETGDGFVLKVGFSLRRMERPVEPGAPRRAIAPDAQPRPQRAALSLAATLKYLWAAAGLNRYSPGSQRPWGEVHSHLSTMAAQGFIGQQRLASLLYAVPPFERERKDAIAAAWSAFLARFERTAQSTPLSLVQGEIKNSERQGHSVKTNLRHHAPPLYLSLPLASALARRYSIAEARLARASGQGRVIGLYQLEISSRGPRMRPSIARED